jgi:glycosyltransferase involved in cell wall biosynthesis
VVKITSERIYIAIPCYNRGRILAQCVPTVHAGRLPRDLLNLYNDGSTEYPNDWLRQYGDLVHESNLHVGIEAQRLVHVSDYWDSRNIYDFLYLTDADALHDPSWRTQALGIYHEHGNHPVCLYNTEAHRKIGGNTIEDRPEENVIWRKYAPGVSWLLSREHVRQIMGDARIVQHWDWNFCDILGNRMAVSRRSYVDHIGLGGLHHPPGAGLDEGDRALSPTIWLAAKRAEVVKELSK